MCEDSLVQPSRHQQIPGSICFTLLTIDSECGLTDKQMPSSTSRVVPRPKNNFTWTGGWVSTSPGQARSIAARYGGAPTNPNLKTDAEVANMGDAAQAKADTDMVAAQNTAQNEQNLAAVETRGNLAAAAPMLQPGTTNVVQPGQVTGATVSPVAPATAVAGGGLVNPNVGNTAAQQAEQNWLDRGGSVATMHRAQVAQGRRPFIDARATPSPADAGPSASDEIRSGFGSGPGQEGHSPWPATTFGNAGSAVWAEMTQKFNANRAKVRQSIAPITPVNPATPKFTPGSVDEDAAGYTN